MPIALNRFELHSINTAETEPIFQKIPRIIIVRCSRAVGQRSNGAVRW